MNQYNRYIVFPRYAVFGNGRNEWEVVLLYGNAKSRGHRAVDIIATYTALREIAIHKASKEKKRQGPRNMGIVEGYGRAQTRALKKLKLLEQDG